MIVFLTSCVKSIALPYWGWFKQFESELKKPNAEITISFRQGRDWLGNITGRKEVHVISVVDTNTTRRSPIVRWSADRFSQTKLWLAVSELVKLAASHPNRIFVLDKNGVKTPLTSEGI